MIKVVLVGTGNVALHLFQAWKDHPEVEVIQVVGRSQQALDTFAADTNVSLLENADNNADIYLLAVSDDAIPEVASALPFFDRLMLHTAGNVALDVFGSKQRGGVFYPLQTFSPSRKPDFQGIPICIESNHSEDLSRIRELGKTLSDNVREISSEQRRVLHLAAVFVNNFTNHLFNISEDLLRSSDLNAELLKPLIRETVAKLEVMSAEEAQTGPARRGDIGTIQKHLELLNNPTHKEIYNTISRSIGEYYGTKL